MDFKEPKKRVTKNDKRHRKQVFSQKCIRLKTQLLEKKLEEEHRKKPT
jgi:hypothetical protein